MYQPARASIRQSASAASSPRTNPLKSNNDREDTETTQSGQAPTPGGKMADSGSDLGSSQNLDDRRAEQVKEAHKLNQIVQQFFVKGALTIASSRAALPQAYNKSGALRQNKWFNLLLDDSDDLLGQTTDWRTVRLESGDRPPPLILEVYLDLDELTTNQSLVIIDDDDRRWDVAGELARSSTAQRVASRANRSTQIVLERWEISLGEMASNAEPEPLHNVYKKAVPLFRALYTLTRQLPAWKLHRRIARQPASHPTLKPSYRILNAEFRNPRIDTLGLPLYPNQTEIVENFSLSPLHCPAGRLHISVQYRSSCDFRVDDSESLLSSHFIGMDNRYFQPTLVSREAGGVPSSVPTHRNLRETEQGQSQVYGSMSTFHNVGPGPGTSPISALRAAMNVGSASPGTPPQKIPPNHRVALSSRSSLRQNDPTGSMARRTSVSFQPFKAGSLASSPASGMQVPLSPTSSTGRQPVQVSSTHTRHRHSLSAQATSQTAQRLSSLPNEISIPLSSSSSPRPAPVNRYSSSFSHRRSRFSSGGGSTSKVEDDQNSSGKHSASSSTRREAGGSDVINDGQAGGSSGSIPTTQNDDDNLKDFIRLLEQKKDLKSFSRTDSASRDASMRRTTAALSKYQRMRESNAALSDSLTSSLLLHGSSSSSSRQLNAVPQMIPGSSISTSSSPGKPISPHTPHTPAIPSRLAANEILTYDDLPRRSRSRVMRRAEDEEEEAESDSTTRERGAIDIPTSPSALPYQRRSSSVAQEHRSFAEDIPELYGPRSASLPDGSDERVNLGMSGLLGSRPSGDAALPTGRIAGEDGRADRTASAFPVLHQTLRDREEDSATLPTETFTTAPTRSSRRFSRRGSSRGSPSYGSVSGSTSAQAFVSAQAGHGSENASSRGGGSSRYGFGSKQSQSQSQSQQQDDDEPIMFAMSDIAQAGRRSIDESRGGSSAGARGTKDGRGSSWR